MRNLKYFLLTLWIALCLAPLVLSAADVARSPGVFEILPGTGITTSPSPCTYATKCTINTTPGSGGLGTVTSVALSLPGMQCTVSGSPVTTTGTLTCTANTESANTVWAGPTSGGAAQPTFRALVQADISSLPIQCSQLPALTGDVTTSSGSCATTYQPSTLPTAPQGRLTLQSNFGVQGQDQIGVSTIYYGPFNGTRVPMWNGSTFTLLNVSSQISMGLDSGVPHIAANNLYDIFAVNNSGSVALCAGPAWNYSSTVTITIATPAVVTWTGHGLPEGAPVVFTTTGALPTGITAGTTYYVGKSPATNTFNISTSVANASAGTFVNTSGSQSGTQTATNGSGGTGLATARGSGAGTTELNFTSSGGLWTNNNALTHCWGGASGTTDYGSIAAHQATYLGTFFATANGQTTFAMQPSAANGGSCNAILGLWNAYNRINFKARNSDNGSQFTRTTNTWVPFNPSGTNGGTCNRISYVDGLAETVIDAQAQTLYFTTSTGTTQLGVVRDSTTATPFNISTGQTGGAANTAGVLPVQDSFYPIVGFHSIQPMVNNGNNANNATFNTAPQYQFIVRADE